MRVCVCPTTRFNLLPLQTGKLLGPSSSALMKTSPFQQHYCWTFFLLLIVASAVAHAPHESRKPFIPHPTPSPYTTPPLPVEHRATVSLATPSCPTLDCLFRSHLPHSIHDIFVRRVTNEPLRKGSPLMALANPVFPVAIVAGHT